MLAALSFGDLMKVIELLYSMQCFSLSALFIESCMEQQLLKKTDKNSILILQSAVVRVIAWSFLSISYDYQ